MDSLKFCGPATLTYIMVMIAIKTTFINDVNPLTIKGRHTNYTWILERIFLMGTVNQTTYLNRIPGIDKYEHNYTSVMSRKHNDNDGGNVVNADNIYIALNDDSQGEELNIDDIRVFDIKDGQLKEIKKETSDYSKVSTSDETVDKHGLDKLLKQPIVKYEEPDRDQLQTYNQLLSHKHIGKFKVEEKSGGSKIDPLILFENNEDNAIQNVINNNGILATRRDGDPKAKSKNTALLHRQQKRKRDMINLFLKDNYLTTNYFFKEVKRIIRNRIIKDDLRLMVEDLDKDANKNIRAVVSKYYSNLIKKRKQYLYNKDFWKQPVNNLVIQHVRDPYNDGE